MKTQNKIRRLAALVALFALLLSTPVSALSGGESEKTVYLGGMPFGISFSTGQLKIGGFDDVETENGVLSPAKDAGLSENDIIVSIDGKEVKSALDVTVAVKQGGGKQIEFSVMRGEEELTVSVTPALSKETGDFRLGLWLEDTTAGLGTVTYIDKDTGEFGGLGHGIVKSDTGELSDFSRGVVSEVEISGVAKGEAGEPGELKGDFLPTKLGVVTKNTNEGVFGVLTSLPEKCEKKEITLGDTDEVKNGGASIFCTVDGETVCEYGVEITCLDDVTEGCKNFLITVTDTSLIEKTGGIVRGMSGSPVVQDGKLIGAVTHVLVNDPCRGYGIFIENMMDAAG